MFSAFIAVFVSMICQLFGSRRLPTVRTAVRVRLGIDSLEDRVLFALYVWTGADNGVNLNWSNRPNWSVDAQIPAQAPGPNDDLLFDDTGFGNPKTVYSSVVDAAFGGQARSITVKASYIATATNTPAHITLNRNLLIAGWYAKVEGGVIDGAGYFDIGDDTNAAGLAWTGGTLAANTRLGHISIGTISGGSKTLKASEFSNRGAVTYTRGDLEFKEQAIFRNEQGSTFSAQIHVARATISGNDDTSFIVEPGASFTVNETVTSIGLHIRANAPRSCYFPRICVARTSIDNGVSQRKS